MFEFLVLSHPIIWVPILIAFLVVETILVEKDSYGWATLVFGGTLVALQAFSDVKPFTLATQNPWAFLIIVAAYFAGGGLYSIVKWYSYTKKIEDKIGDEVEEKLRGVSAESLAADSSILNRALSNAKSRYATGLTYPLLVSEHKAKITAWMAYWPISGIFTLLDDPIRRIFRAIYRRMAGTLQGISDRSAARLEQRFRG